MTQQAQRCRDLETKPEMDFYRRTKTSPPTHRINGQENVLIRGKNGRISLNADKGENSEIL